MITGTIDINTLLLLLIGLITLANTWYSRRTEKNTNSMKDALVKVTGENAHAKGREEARIEGENKASALAQSNLEGKNS